MTALILCWRSAASLASICFDVGAAPPVGRQEIDVELEFLGNAEPQHRELAGLGHQHLVAGRQRIDDRGFPGAGARRRDRSSPAAWCGKCAGSPPARHDRVRRIRHRDDPWWACPWPAAPGRARWSALESEENAFQCAGSSSVLPGQSRLCSGRISPFGGLVPCPAGAVNALEGGTFACFCHARYAAGLQTPPRS